MSTDLRVSFKERHRKRLYKAIDMVLPPVKKGCLEKVREEIGRETLVTPVPQPDVMGSSRVLIAEEKAGLPYGGPLMAPSPTRKSRTIRTLLHPPPLLAGMK